MITNKYFEQQAQAAILMFDHECALVQKATELGLDIDTIHGEYFISGDEEATNEFIKFMQGEIMRMTPKKTMTIKEGRPPETIEEYLENTQYQGEDVDNWEDVPVDESDE